MEDVFVHKTYLIPYHLQFFADEGGERTEDATSKKLSDARKKGQVARSTELITATGLLTLFISLKLFIGYISDHFLTSMRKSFLDLDKLSKGEFTATKFEGLLSDSLGNILLICIPIFALAIVSSVGVILFQVKWKISASIMKPKFEKINPLKGFKKIFSKDKLVTMLVELIKIGVITYIAYDTLKDEWATLFNLYDIDLEPAILLIGQMVIDLGMRISIIFIIIGIFDYFYQKLKFKKDMKMTKQEVKDEFKNSEGDPQVKGRIRTKMREASQRRMMQAIPQADVVITNPTHLAAAIKYDRETSQAPVLVAKGADFLAQKIKEIAKENKIEIVENKPLARMLYYNVELGAEIPPELYQMTAEVLAYVYGLKKDSNVKSR